MLPNYQIKIADFGIFLLPLFKNWGITFFIKKVMCFIVKTYNLIKNLDENKKKTLCIRIQSITEAKIIC